MRLSFDNNWLFTAGSDGCLMLHKVDDRDVRGGVKNRDSSGTTIMPFSDEIQTQKSEMEDNLAKKEQLENDLEGIKEPATGGQSNASND